MVKEKQNNQPEKSPAKKSVKNAIKKSGKTSDQKKKALKKSGNKKTDASTGERKYVLDSVLVINNAQTIHGQLTALINAKQNIVIDASSVEMADTSILQLLLSFVKKIHTQNLKVRWENPSHELLSRAEMLDLKERLGLAGS